MRLVELMDRYEERARVAKLQQSTAPVAKVYRMVLDELAEVDGFESMGQWMNSGSAAGVLDVSAKTVRKWCNEGRFPSAYKTSGDEGEWRIPTHEVYINAGGSNAKVASVPKLWRPDE